MSYSCYLTDPVTKDVLELPNKHFIEGGIYEMGGSKFMELNVTYNYGPIIHSVMEGGIPGLNGKTGAETISVLKNAVDQLKDDVSSDYWDPTEGNAKRALCGLMAFAQMRPDGVWEIV